METQVQPDFLLSSQEFEPANLRLYRTWELKQSPQQQEYVDAMTLVRETGVYRFAEN